MPGSFRAIPTAGYWSVSTGQDFLNELNKKLWTSANKLLPSLDAAVYKHVILGLVFLKYVSDAFDERQEELRRQFTNPEDDYCATCSTFRRPRAPGARTSVRCADRSSAA